MNARNEAQRTSSPPLPAKDALPYAIGFYLGMRRGEQRRFEWTDIDFDRNRVVVPKSSGDIRGGS